MVSCACETELGILLVIVALSPDDRIADTT